MKQASDICKVFCKVICKVICKVFCKVLKRKTITATMRHIRLSNTPFVLLALILAMVFGPSLAGSLPFGGGHDNTKGKAVNGKNATKRQATELSDSLSDTLPRDARRRYDYFFLEAVRQQNAGHFDAAFDLLAHCMSINPNAAEAYYLQALYYAEMQNDTMALKYLQKAATLSPANDTYQERVAQYYIGTNSYGKAIDAYERLYEHHRDRSDILSVLVQLYRHEKDYTGMLRCLEQMEKVDGPSEELTMAKMNAYEMRGDRKQAYRQLKALVDSHPNEPNYKVMLGNWLLQNDRKPEAYKLFLSAVEADPESEYALGSLYDYYRQAGLDSMATALRDRILLSPKTDTGTKTTMFKQVLKDNEAHGGDSTEVIALFDKVLRANPKDADMALLKAVYMDLKQMPDSAVCPAFQHVLDIAPDNATARLQLLQKLWPQKRWDEIIAQSTQAIQYNPEEMAFYYFLGLAHYQKNDNDAALDAFRRGVGEITQESNPEFVSDFYAIMGDILHTKGQAEEAYAAYDSCLQWKSDNISCLNNYAYYLSEENRNLTKAEEMSYRTVKAEPDNATYLDTYAWILYQQKRYTEAKVYIDQAVRNDTDTTYVDGTDSVALSSVIIEHAGDIYYKVGQPDRAVQYWQRAIQRGGDKAALEQKIRKARKK